MKEKQKVLIVDDEPRNRRIIEEMLDDAYDFRNAGSGEEAISAIETYDPDLVLLDIMMPGIDGYEVCRRLRANSKLKFTKVILVSGKAMVEERLQGYAAGADDYMTKPFAAEELLAKAKVFLKLAHTERELAELNRDLEQKVESRTQQLVEAEEKLVTAAKMSALGEMAGGIAHEINTPLATIAMIVEQIGELIGEDPLDKKMVIEMTNTASRTIHRIGGIIRGLRTFSRDASQDQFNVLPLQQMIEETMVLCQERLKHANVKLELRPIADDLKIECRSVQITQVLINLIGNACDAIQAVPEKWIEIQAQARGKEIELTVTDSGPGIPADLRNRIFQPFFTTKEIGKGTGLGLSVSQGIMTAHRGSIRVDGDSPRTRFVLRFPNPAADKGGL